MVIDADYRGEAIVALHNDLDDAQMVPAGSRIAQLIIMDYTPVSLFEVDNLDSTERGSEGFGSSGLS